MTLSVTLMIVVDSLFTGYIEALQNSAVANMGNIFLWPHGRAIPKYDVFLEGLEKLDEIEAVAPFTFGGGLLYLESGDVHEVTIQGIEPAQETRFTDWKGVLLRQQKLGGQVNFEVPGDAGEDGCWLGINIVAEPNEETDEYDLAKVKELIGKQVVLTTVGAMKKRKVVKLRISDIATTQTYFGDQTLYLPLAKFNKIVLGGDGTRHWWETKIKLKDRVDPQSAKDVIRGVWERFASEELGGDSENVARISIHMVQEQYGKWIAELHKQMGVLLLIFGVICSVAVLLIFCVFYMIVETKQKDIAIIKSCGATKSTAAIIFLGFGACVGIVGSVLGIIGGYIVTKNINTLEQWVRVVFGLKLWRASSYMLNTIPSQVNWPGVWPIVLAAVVGCCLGALIPAIVAARLKPVEILRYE